MDETIGEIENLNPPALPGQEFLDAEEKKLSTKIAEIIDEGTQIWPAQFGAGAIFAAMGAYEVVSHDANAIAYSGLAWAGVGLIGLAWRKIRGFHMLDDHYKGEYQGGR